MELRRLRTVPLAQRGTCRRLCPFPVRGGKPYTGSPVQKIVDGQRQFVGDGKPELRHGRGHPGGDRLSPGTVTHHVTGLDTVSPYQAGRLWQ